MDVALSKNGRRALAGFFGLLVAFLYAPILILLIFFLPEGVMGFLQERFARRAPEDHRAPAAGDAHA
jgi:hypothetical protein